jgi:hypothetical protein
MPREQQRNPPPLPTPRDDGSMPYGASTSRPATQSSSRRHTPRQPTSTPNTGRGTIVGRGTHGLGASCFTDYQIQLKNRYSEWSGLKAERRAEDRAASPVLPSLTPRERYDDTKRAALDVREQREDGLEELGASQAKGKNERRRTHRAAREERAEWVRGYVAESVVKEREQRSKVRVGQGIAQQRREQAAEDVRRAAKREQAVLQDELVAEKRKNVEDNRRKRAYVLALHKQALETQQQTRDRVAADAGKTRDERKKYREEWGHHIEGWRADALEYHQNHRVEEKKTLCASRDDWEFRNEEEVARLRGVGAALEDKRKARIAARLDDARENVRRQRDGVAEQTAAARVSLHQQKAEAASDQRVEHLRLQQEKQRDTAAWIEERQSVHNERRVSPKRAEQQAASPSENAVVKTTSFYIAPQ